MTEQEEQIEAQPSRSTDEDAGSEPAPVDVDQSAADQAPLEDEGAQATGPRAPVDPMQALRAERDELESRLLRVTADYQNFVRRSSQNAQDACQQQLMQMAKALLVPLDHFDHAMTVDLEKTSSQTFAKGVQIVRDELMKVLEQFDIKRLEVNAGDPFDPVRHEALQRMPAQDVESGAVAQQIQAGYLLGDKTLRPAKVVVAE